MSIRELIVVSSTPDLAAALMRCEGLRVATGPNLQFAQRQTTTTPLPDAIYADDSLGSPDELWGLVRACQASSVPLLLGLWGAGRSLAGDLADAGIRVAPANARDGAALAAWLAECLELRPRATGTAQALLAIAGAKGGIGKTLVVSLWAEALHRRGLRVLVVDGDLSNSGLLPAFRMPARFPSYLQARADGGGDWATPERLRPYIFRHERSSLHFLLGSDEAANTGADLHLRDWEALMRGVRGLDEFDVVLLDTGPEIKRRPYALLAARAGGHVIFPVPPGRKERVGAGNALHWFADDDGCDLSERCLLLFMEPERGSAVRTAQVMPRMVQLFPRAQVLGTLPRAPRQVSQADEHPDLYLSPLDLAPFSRFTRAVHELVDRTCQLAGITPPLPLPRVRWWQRLRGERMERSAAEIVARPAVVQP